jgi:PAS domain S-box-containing protein
MTHTRPYKEAMTVADAVAEVERSTGSHFDPTVAAAFHRLDPELLASPPILGSDPSLTDGAWRALQDATGITHDETEHATNAAIMAILADTPTATLVIDDARRYISANAAACEMFGLSIDELRKQRIDDFAPAEVRDQLDAIWADFMTVGVQNIVFELQLPDGTKHMTTYRGVAHLLPGRHLLLLTPADDSASAMSAAFVASVDPSDTTNAAGDAGQRVLANGRRG